MNKQLPDEYEANLFSLVQKVQLNQDRNNSLTNFSNLVPDLNERVEHIRIVSAVNVSDKQSDLKLLKLIIKHQLEQYKDNILVHPLDRIMNCKEPVGPITAELLNETLKRGPV